ncbi:hypothetical protein, partial [Embleya sp. NPDC001921]
VGAALDLDLARPYRQPALDRAQVCGLRGELEALLNAAMTLEPAERATIGVLAGLPGTMHT